MTAPNDTAAPGPFGRAAQIYRSAGWEGTLPLGAVPGRKFPPPGGWTGHSAAYPSGADVAAWTETHGDRNLGLRMPPGVIGLDVDAGYKQKQGDKTLAALEARFGPLPPTWVSSARPAPSGIRFFRVPTHLDGREVNWPGEAGPDIEIIQPGHRYAVVWPSINPDAGGAPYEWRHENGDRYAPEDVPAPSDLPDLPESWVRGLALAYDRTEKADLGDGALAAWWDRLRAGDPCPVIHSVWKRAVDELVLPDGGARHETARDALRALVAGGGSGHRGAREAASAVGLAFAAAVGAERAGSGEWNRMLAGAVKLAATDNPWPRQACEHDPAVGLVAPEGFTRPEAASVSGGAIATPISAPAPGALTLPEEFWGARPVLGRIRQAAHHKVRSGDVVFYGVLARLAAMAPHTLRADTGIGDPASLNLFAAIVGPSGSGKSSGISISRSIIKSGESLEEMPLGSGEGIAEAYMGTTERPTGVLSADGGSQKTKPIREQVRHNVLFHTDEGAGLNKLIERAGSTVGETLRTAWSGETIGQKNGRAETTRTVPAGSYSAGLVIGYQESTVLPLLDDVEAGTPQRFLYAWAQDPSIPPVDNPAAPPGELLSPFPANVPTDLPAGGGLVAAAPLPARGVPEVITFAEAIRRELYVSEHGKATGTLPADHPLRDAFRSQHNVLKVKVSSLLALLEARRNVTEEDWRLAQIVLDTSDRVRAHLQAVADVKKAEAARKAAEAEARLETHRAHARAEVGAVLNLEAEKRVAARVATWVHEGGPMTLGALRRRANSADRKLIESAIEYAAGQLWVALEGDGHVHPAHSRPAS